MKKYHSGAIIRNIYRISGRCRIRIL